MFTKFHTVVLRVAYNKGCIEPKYCDKTSLLDGLPSHEVIKAYEDLVKWNYLKPIAGKDKISLNPYQIREIRQILNPSIPDEVKDKPPLEYSYDSAYEKQPFYKAKGDKRVRGKYGIYSYHKNRFDETSLIAFVIVDGEKKGSIKLGSFFDKNSLLSKALKRIDEKYGTQQFSKADLASLRKGIEGNRQPPKAIIDMLLYHGYILCKGNKYYERTEKQLPKTELFESQSQPSTSIELTGEKEDWSKFGFRLPSSNQTTTTAVAHSYPTVEAGGHYSNE
jgi:hypothetical protein